MCCLFVCVCGLRGAVRSVGSLVVSSNELLLPTAAGDAPPRCSQHGLGLIRRETSSRVECRRQVCCNNPLTTISFNCFFFKLGSHSSSNDTLDSLDRPDTLDSQNGNSIHRRHLHHKQKIDATTKKEIEAIHNNALCTRSSPGKCQGLRKWKKKKRFCFCLLESRIIFWGEGLILVSSCEHLIESDEELIFFPHHRLCH